MATVRYTIINGQVVAEKRGGVRKFYASDALGSTVALYDNSQTKTDTFTYWPYGETRTRTGSTATKYKFGGTLGCREQADGGIYMQARVEQPKDGRWMTVDPMWPLQQPFQYAGASPLSSSESQGPAIEPPWTTFCWKWCSSQGKPLHFPCRKHSERVRTTLGCFKLKSEPARCQEVCARPVPPESVVTPDKDCDRCKPPSELLLGGCKDYTKRSQGPAFEIVVIDRCKCRCKVSTVWKEKWCCCCRTRAEIEPGQDARMGLRTC